MSPSRLPFAPGVFMRPDGTLFRVWAPAAREVRLCVESGIAREWPMESIGGGWFQLLTREAPHGTRYRYRLDGDGPWPDPCSRYQPEGPHGPSEVVDPASFRWTDDSWRGRGLHGQVFYELHVGSFTREGSFDAAIAQLPELAALGVTTLEIMPVAEFPGRFNWGYDGVQLFAPFHGYGDAHALRRFVDAAHAQGLAVVLDVVYNHLGPDGNYLAKFAPQYFTDRYPNEWGEALNFDGPGCEGVRAFFLENVRYWIEDFHLDGLRLDATQSIFDASEPHILAEMVAKARAAAGARDIVITAENEPQQSWCLLPPERGGYGLDAMWNDDFHHAARVAACGTHDGYFHDYRGTPQEFISSLKRGFLYQGQYYAWQKQRRGAPVADQPAAAFVHFLQNHDQVANTFFGRRLHGLTSPGRERALTALLLLGPQTPLLFMGQEFAATAPFPFFADHNAELRAKVHEGRREFLAQFRTYATPEARERVLDPGALATFESAKLDFGERERHAQVLQMHRDLLRLRREDPVIARQDRFALDGAVLGSHCFALRWTGPDGEGDRLLVVNLGVQCDLSVVPEPLLAPPRDGGWRSLWSSDHPDYGGPGVMSPCDAEGRWFLAGEQATLLCSVVEERKDAR